MDVHEKAVQRHNHYARHGLKLPPKLVRFRATWPRAEQRQERVRDEHVAVLYRKSLIGKFV